MFGTSEAREEPCLWSRLGTAGSHADRVSHNGSLIPPPRKSVTFKRH